MCYNDCSFTLWRSAADVDVTHFSFTATVNGLHTALLSVLAFILVLPVASDVDSFVIA